MAELEPSRLALLVVHLVGIALIVGPYLARFRDLARLDARIPLAGAIVQFLAALGLVIVREATEEGVTGGMVAVKIIVSLCVLGVTIVAVDLKREKRAVHERWLHVSAAVALLNAIIAIVWA